jgi:hypothetical protein
MVIYLYYQCSFFICKYWFYTKIKLIFNFLSIHLNNIFYRIIIIILLWGLELLDNKISRLLFIFYKMEELKNAHYGRLLAS